MRGQDVCAPVFCTGLICPHICCRVTAFGVFVSDFFKPWMRQGVKSCRIFGGQTAKRASGTGRETGCGKNRPEELLYIAADVYYNRQYQNFFISLFRHGRYRYCEFLVTGYILMSGLHMHPGIWPGCFFMGVFECTNCFLCDVIMIFISRS